MRHPPITPVGTPAPHIDSSFLEHIIRAVVVGMSSVAALAALVSLKPINNMVRLVCLMKIIREIGCEPFLGEQDAKIAARWIQKMEKILNHITVLEELYVDCAT